MKKKETEPTTQISVRFPESLFTGIEAISAKERRKLANVVQLLVAEALESRGLLSDSGPGQPPSGGP